MKPVQQVSDSELTLLRIIWDNGGTALFAQISDELENRGLCWKKNTVLTFLSRLVEKGLLSTSKIGRRNEYTALASEEDYLAVQTKVFLDRVYAGNVSGLVNTLLRQDLVGQDELEKLRRFWKEGEIHGSDNGDA